MSEAGTLYQNYLSKSNFARIRTLDSSAWSDQVSWDAVGSSQALNPQLNKREPFFATAACATLTCRSRQVVHGSYEKDGKPPYLFQVRWTL